MPLWLRKIPRLGLFILKKMIDPYTKTPMIMNQDGTIFQFLNGSHSYEGVWFGENHPTRKGSFWWRSVLDEEIASLKKSMFEAGTKAQREIDSDIAFDCATDECGPIMTEHRVLAAPLATLNE